jgi:hypothetical protein
MYCRYFDDVVHMDKLNLERYDGFEICMCIHTRNVKTAFVNL